MNEAFQRPNQKNAPIDADKSADSGSSLKKIHYETKSRVMRHPEFSKTTFFHMFSYFFIPIKIETGIWQCNMAEPSPALHWRR